MAAIQGKRKKERQYTGGEKKREKEDRQR